MLGGSGWVLSVGLFSEVRAGAFFASSVQSQAGPNICAHRRPPARLEATLRAGTSPALHAARKGPESPASNRPFSSNKYLLSINKNSKIVLFLLDSVLLKF